MSADRQSFAELENDLQRIFEATFARKADRFSAVGLTVRVDPLARVGQRSTYKSFVEATVLGRDAVPCDVAFAHIVYGGKPVIDKPTFEAWAEQITDDLIRENGASGAV